MDWLNMQVANEMAKERIEKASQRAEYEAQLMEWDETQPQTSELNTLFNKLREAFKHHRPAPSSTKSQTA